MGTKIEWTEAMLNKARLFLAEANQDYIPDDTFLYDDIEEWLKESGQYPEEVVSD